MQSSLHAKIQTCINVAQQRFGGEPWEDIEDIVERVARQNRNHGAICLAWGLLSQFNDLKAFVLDARVLKEFDLQGEFGIDPSPLFNLNTLTPTATSVVELEIAGEAHDARFRYTALLEMIDEIRAFKLLGKHTAGKLAFVQNVTHTSRSKLQPSDDEDELFELEEATLELLGRHLARIDSANRNVERIQRMVRRLRADVALHDLKILYSRRFRQVADITRFCELYADEILQDNADLCQTQGQGSKPIATTEECDHIEVRYARRNRKFPKIGDRYGDCTSLMARHQTERGGHNIHWTAYSFLLDPYYRVLEASYNGQPAIKGHLVPLVIQGRRVLCLDAVEVVPQLRGRVRGKENRFQSEELSAVRTLLLESLFERTREIGGRMRVDAIYVDHFSNADWVRETVERLPAMGYHVSEVEKPFEYEAIEWMLKDLLDVEGEQVESEIQAVDVKLMDQGLRYGYKAVGVLDGEFEATMFGVKGP